MNKQQKEALEIMHLAHSQLVTKGEKLNLGRGAFLDTIETLIDVFGKSVSEDSIDDCINLIGAAYLAGYRGLRKGHKPSDGQ